MTNDGLKILLIEDEVSFAWLVQRACSHHVVSHVIRVGNALQEMADSKFDVVLTDLTLPDASQLESVEKLRAYDPDIPLIVLTSLGSTQLAMETLKSGAQDFIVKDLMTKELLERSIRLAIERQRIAAENRRLVDSLEAQQRQLNEKNKRLSELVATAHRFTDNVSHEFRTPLTVIREYASIMRDGLVGEVNLEQTQFLEVIGYRVDDLSRMVDDMLDSSKLAAGIMGLHRVPTNPVEIIARPLDGLKLKARVRGVQLCFDKDHVDDLPQVFCDAEKAGRVLTNLVSNAIKFCDEGRGRVVVGLRNRPEDAAVEISVSDDGPGIDADDLKRMFDRFQQLDTTTQCSTKGFGLGLNIARELVHQNYGTIEVESELGEGTTFRFTLPVDDWRNIVRQYVTRVSRSESTARVAVVDVTLPDGPSASSAKDLDAFWRYTQRPTDLIRQTGPAKWTLLLAAERSTVNTAIARFEAAHAKINRSRPTALPTIVFDTVGCFVAGAESDALIHAACGDIVIRPHESEPVGISQRTTKSLRSSARPY